MEPKTWIKKLDDPRESKEAVRQLVKLKNPVAVPALIEQFKKSRDPEQLKAVATFADARAAQTFIDSLEYSEEAFDNASIAATALGDIKDLGPMKDKAVEALIKAVQKPLPIKTRANVVKLESMKALAKIKDPKAVDVLVKIVTTPADEQDFFLNKVGAKALGDFADPKAVPALVRGMFMTGRGADIFQPCRTALVAIGEPAVDKLVEAMQRKNAEIEADAKKYEFFPGIIVQKTSALLGDIHSKKAVPALVEELAKKDDGLAAGPGKGVSGHQSVLLALGQIGDPAALKTLNAVFEDTKRPAKLRAAAAEAMNLLGDPAGIPILGKAKGIKWLDTKTKLIDPDPAAVFATAITAYSRLASFDSPELGIEKAEALEKEMGEPSDISMTIRNVFARIDVAKKCKKDIECYAAILDEKPAGDEAAQVALTNRAEKAVFQLARLGKDALPVLSKHIGHREAVVRMTVLYALTYIANTCGDCKAEIGKAIDALEKQIGVDQSKPPLRPLVDEMRVTHAGMLHFR